MSNLISRQDAIRAYCEHQCGKGMIRGECGCDDCGNIFDDLPSEQPEIIRCKDCRWWDKYGIYDNGYCMAVKHGYWSEHWEIRIRRIYKGDFYCADAERRTNEIN